MVGVLEAVVEVHELRLGRLEDVGVLVGVLTLRDLPLRRGASARGALVGRLLLLLLLLLGGVVVADGCRVRVVGHNHHLKDFERVRVVGGRGRDTELVAGRDAEAAGLEAQVAVDLDTERSRRLSELDLRGSAQVSVVVAAVAKRQLIDVALPREIDGAVVEETTDHTARAAVCVHHKSQTVKLSDGVDAAGADRGRTVTDQPDVEVASAAIGPVGSEVDVGDPLVAEQRLLTPYGTALVTGGERREDDAVGENLWHLGDALEGKVGDLPSGFGGTYPRRGGQRHTRVVLH